MKAILVTGGRGFIGSRLVQHLIASQGRPVVSADVIPPTPVDKVERRIDVNVDIGDCETLRDIFSRFDITVVFDLASITQVGLSRSIYSRNTEMTRSMIACINHCNVPKYVFYSTQLVFRKAGVLPANDRDYYPTDPYAESKIESEELIRNSLSPDRWLILRPTYIWGEGHRRFRDGFLYRLAKGQMILPTNKQLVRYYGYVDTICEQTRKLAEQRFSELKLRTYYLSDNPISMQEFCDHFIAALGAGRTWKVPAAWLRALGSLGDLVAKSGLSFPIRGLQADEMTRSYPVPVEPTLSVTGTATNYRRAATAVVAWALSDPEFKRRIGR